MSATQLKLASLVDDEQPGVKRLRWDKPRGGGEQLAIPFSQGGINAKAIPRIWEKIVLASSELRSQAPIHLRGELFLWANGEGKKLRRQSVDERRLGFYPQIPQWIFFADAAHVGDDPDAFSFARTFGVNRPGVDPQHRD